MSIHLFRDAILLSLLLSTTGCATRRYVGSGVVLDVSRMDQTLTVSHDRIPGYMEAMVMPFAVRDSRLLDRVERGNQIRFRLAVAKKSSYLDHLVITSAPALDPDRSADSPTRGAIATGELVPDFELTDQNANRVSISKLRGKVIAVSFIYTRCPLPDYCPRMTSNFISLWNRFSGRVGRDLVLLSVTLDPGYDAPDVLSRYAKSFSAAKEGWYFLTGGKDEIARVCALFGIEYWPDEGAITHNLQTGLLDRDGRMAAKIEGKDYTAKQLGDLVELLLRP